MNINLNFPSTNYHVIKTSVLIGLVTLTMYRIKKYFENSEFLFNAAHANSSIRIKLAIASGAKVNDRKDSQTPLMIAARKGNLEGVKALIGARADVNIQDSLSATALIHVTLGAAKSNPGVFKRESEDVRYAEVVKTIIDARADVNVQDGLGATALIHSVDYEGSSRYIVEAILKGGADTSIADLEGENAVMKAARKVNDINADILDILCGAGAKTCLPITQRMMYDSPIHYIIHEADKYYHKLHENYHLTRIDIEAMKKLTALILAADAGKVSMTKYLVMPAYSNEGGYYHTRQCEIFEAAIALMLAAKKGNHEIVDAVINGKGSLAYSADSILKNAQDKDGRTALMLAAEKGYDQVVSNIVVPRGFYFIRPFLDLQDDEGRTALMLAAAGGHRKVIHILLKEGANEKLKDTNGKIALLHASENGHLDQFVKSVKQLRVENIEKNIPSMPSEVCGLMVDYAFKNPSVEDPF